MRYPTTFKNIKIDKLVNHAIIRTNLAQFPYTPLLTNSGMRVVKKDRYFSYAATCYVNIYGENFIQGRITTHDGFQIRRELIAHDIYNADGAIVCHYP